MNKFKLLLLICALFAFSYYFSIDVRNAVLKASDFVIEKTYDTYESIQNEINKYFDQVDEIEYLQSENKELNKYKLLYENIKIDYESLLKANNLKKYDFTLSLARVLSYEKISQLSKFWMSYENIVPNKAYGLVYSDNAVGIMYENNGRAYGVSLNDEKCIFSVRIGDKKIPAVVQGTRNNVYVNFIIDYEKIKTGDEVYTSGMDGIFLDGIYVGKIAEIFDEAGYKKALLEDTKQLKPYRYVYVIDIKQ